MHVLQSHKRQKNCHNGRNHKNTGWTRPPCQKIMSVPSTSVHARLHPGSSVCVFLPLSVCLHVYLYLLFYSLCLALCHPLSICLSFPLCLSVLTQFLGPYVFLFLVSLRVYLSWSVCVSVFLFICLSLSLFSISCQYFKSSNKLTQRAEITTTSVVYASRQEPGYNGWILSTRLSGMAPEAKR